MKISTFKLTTLAVFTAIIAGISFLPIRTMGLEITLSMVPVAVGAICFGPAAGAYLGGVFGFVSFLQCFGYSQFGAMLLSINPIFTFITCVPTRILAGWVSGLVFKWISNSDKSGRRGYIAASFTAPIMNTVLFMGTLTVCFYTTEYVQGISKSLGAANPITFIILFAGINALIEMAVGFVLAYPISKTFAKAYRKMKR